MRPLYFVPIALLFALAYAVPAARAADVVVAVAIPASSKGSAGVAARLIASDIAARQEPGMPVLRIEVHDDPCDRVRSAALARAIAASAAISVIGHGCAAAVAAAAPLYAAASKPFIVAGGSAGGSRLPAGPMYLPGLAETQGQYLGRETARVATVTSRIAVVSDRTRWALTNVREASAALQAVGKAPVQAEAFSGGDKDFAALAARLAAARITHVVLAAFGSEAGLFVADLVKALPEVVVIGTETLAGPEFVRAAGPATRNVLIGVKPDVLSLKAISSAARDLAERLERDRLRALSGDIWVAAAVGMVASAANTVNVRGVKVTPVALGEELRRQAPAFETILGPISFGATGQSSVGQWRLHRFDQGALKPVQ